MELSDSRLIHELLTVQKRPRRNVRRGCAESLAQPAVRGTRRCQCGHCPPCLENARWERIFAEKFADPEYYKPRPAPSGSSLSWLV